MARTRDDLWRDFPKTATEFEERPAGCTWMATLKTASAGTYQ
jgi:hypothetical protein